MGHHHHHHENLYFQSHMTDELLERLRQLFEELHERGTEIVVEVHINGERDEIRVRNISKEELKKLLERIREKIEREGSSEVEVNVHSGGQTWTFNEK
uniref:De novo Designed Protein Foldit3 n=1 Tax=synthetic construct TaxID=32630 RepID=UPI00111186A3|nr:Chain A, De novo Designed Protein Foldit3 [synthetic construct]